MMELSKKITDILEKHEFSVCGEITERYREFNQYDIDLEVYSPEGEDVIVSLIFDGTDEDFIREFNRYANDFDPDEHAEMWIDHRGENGVPNSIRDLLDDADWIKRTLMEVAEELNNIDKKEVEDLKTYKCTISITDGENIEEQDFYFEANSFEEAVENIKNELNI